MKYIGHTIRLLRERKGITAKKLAADAKIDPGYLSKLEQEKSRMNIAVLDSIAESLGTQAWKIWKAAEFYRDNVAPRIDELMENIRKDTF